MPTDERMNVHGSPHQKFNMIGAVSPMLTDVGLGGLQSMILDVTNHKQIWVKVPHSSRIGLVLLTYLNLHCLHSCIQSHRSKLNE